MLHVPGTPSPKLTELRIIHQGRFLQDEKTLKGAPQPPTAAAGGVLAECPSRERVLAARALSSAAASRQRATLTSSAQVWLASA